MRYSRSSVHSQNVCATCFVHTYTHTYIHTYIHTGNHAHPGHAYLRHTYMHARARAYAFTHLLRFVYINIWRFHLCTLTMRKPFIGRTYFNGRHFCSVTQDTFHYPLNTISTLWPIDAPSHRMTIAPMYVSYVATRIVRR